MPLILGVVEEQDARLQGSIQGFPKIRDTFLAVPIIRTIIYWGLYWGTLILGNYHTVLTIPIPASATSNRSGSPLY